MKTYTTNHLVKHNAKDYPEGKKIQLEDDDAEALLAAGAISAPKDDEKKTDKK